MANGLEQYEWDFIDPPMNDLYCPMCKEILKEPMLTECCGSHFCRTCIHPILKAKQPCPNPECNKTDYNCIIDRPKWKRVLELDVLCPLKGRGCNWKGEVGTREKHLDPDEGDCDYIDMDCSYGCGENMERYELAEHLDRFCPKRPYTCQHCGLAEVYDSIVNEHTPVCLKYLVPCGNKCGREDIPRASYDQHLLTCPEQEIECEFRYAGCDVRLPRKNLPKHAQDDVHVHLSLQISFASSELSKRDQQLEKLSSAWENKHKELNKEIERLSRQSEQDTNEREEDFSRMKRELKLKEDKISELEAMMKEKREMFEQQGLAMDRMEASLTRMGESQKGSEKNLQRKVESLSVACKERHQEAANQMEKDQSQIKTGLSQKETQILELETLLRQNMAKVDKHETRFEALQQALEKTRAELAQKDIVLDKKHKTLFNTGVKVESLSESLYHKGISIDQNRRSIERHGANFNTHDRSIAQLQGQVRDLQASLLQNSQNVDITRERIDLRERRKSNVSHSEAAPHVTTPILDPTPEVKTVSTSSRQINQAKKLLADEQAKRMVVAATSSKPTSTTEVILLSNDRKLTLKKEDIVKEDVDMIVNPTNKCLLHAGGVAGALNRASNGQLQKHSSRYVQKKGEVPVGSVGVTQGGGALKCNRVIHAVGPDRTYSQADCERLLNRVIGEVLKCAERHNATSIAIPAISSGIFGVKKEVVARCVTDAIIAYNFSKPHPCISDIRIVIWDEPTYTPFAQYFEGKRKTLDTSKPVQLSLIKPAKFVSPTTSGGSKSSPSTVTSTPPVSKGHQLGASGGSLPMTSPSIALELPDTKLELTNDLSKIQSLTKSLASDWRHLGSLLGLTNDTLELIASTPASPNVYLNRLLMKWMCGYAEPPTVAVLVKALNRMSGTEDIVQQIIDAYGDRDDKAVKQPSPGQADYTNDLDNNIPPNLPQPLEPQPVDSADKNSIGSGKTAASTSGGPQSTASAPPTSIAIHNDLNPSAHSQEQTTTVSSGAEGMGQEQPTTGLFKQAVYDQSSSVLGTPSHVSSALTTTTTSSGISLMPTTATSHPLQTGTSSTAVSSPPPGFYGQDLSFSSSGMGGNYPQTMGVGGQPTGVGTTHYSQAMGTGGLPIGRGTTQYSQAVGTGGQPTGVGTTHYSQAVGTGGQPTGVGTTHYSQAVGTGGQPTGRGTTQYSQAVGTGGQPIGVGTTHYSRAVGTGGQPTGWGTTQYSQTSWSDTSGRGMNNAHAAAKSGQPGWGGEQYHGLVGAQHSHSAMGGGSQHGGERMYYSQLVAGTAQGANDGMQYVPGDGSNVVTSQPGSQDWSSNETGAEGHLNGPHNQGYPSSGGTSHGVSKQESKEDECPICLSDFTDPFKTKCGHVFCRHCISEALQHSSFCPTCKAALRAIVGNQPVGGTMNVQYSRSPLPGYQRYGSIEIHYYIPGGVQAKEHPNPGQRYSGTSRRAYLPNSPEGQEVLRLLQKAFDARLVFTVGTSVTSGQRNVVTWNDIHHKTNTHGGQQAYGYPDPTYLQRVKADLAAKGIVLEDKTHSVV